MAQRARRMIMIGGWADIYKKAKASGFDVTVLQKAKDIKLEDLAIADTVISLSKTSDASMVELVTALHGAKPFDVVLSFQEFGVLAAARIKDQLGIAGNPLEPVLLTKDKGLMREHMQANGIASIPFKVVQNADDAVKFGHAAGWPIIVKPIDGSGSRQIHKLNSADEVKAALDGIKGEYPLSASLAEKFITGPEVSVEAISWDGRHKIIGVTDKITTGAPHFVEKGHTMPSALPPATLSAVHELVTRFLDSIANRFGPSHTEVIISPNGPVIVESHTRVGGDRIFEMVELAYGVDMFSATLQGFAGNFPEIVVENRGGVAIRYLTLPDGCIAEVSGCEAAGQAAGVVRCDIDLQVGKQVKSFRSSDERYGYILAVGNSRADAVRNATEALETISVRMAPN